MPCRYDPTPEEIRASQEARERRIREPLEKENASAKREIRDLEDTVHALSVRCDRLGDLVWSLAHRDTTGRFSDEIEEALSWQTEHRRRDLVRIMKATDDYEVLRKVALADPTRPLKPQLGFDPDDY